MPEDKKNAPEPLQVNVKVTDEQKNKILEELFTNGYTTIDFEVIPGKVSVTLKSLSAADQMTVERFMSDLQGSTTFILHAYTIEVLACTMLKYGDSEFKQVADAKQFLEKLPSIVLDKLIKIQNSFEQQLRSVLQFEEINNYFFETPSTQKK